MTETDAKLADRLERLAADPGTVWVSQIGPMIRQAARTIRRLGDTQATTSAPTASAIVRPELAVDAAQLEMWGA